MDYPQEPGPHEKPGKLTMLAFAGLLGAAIIGVLALGIGQRDTDVASPGGQQLAFSDQPTAGQIAECNQYAAQVAREGTFPGSPPAVGDSDQSLVGLSDENRYSDVARAAYRDCMLGIQHDS
jgi:hypothetical protein